MLGSGNYSCKEDCKTSVITFISIQGTGKCRLTTLLVYFGRGPKVDKTRTDKVVS